MSVVAEASDVQIFEEEIYSFLCDVGCGFQFGMDTKDQLLNVDPD